MPGKEKEELPKWVPDWLKAKMAAVAEARREKAEKAKMEEAKPSSS